MEYWPASKGIEGPLTTLTSRGLLCTDALPWLFKRLVEALGIEPDDVLKPTAPVGVPYPEFPTTVALMNTGEPKAIVLKGTDHCPAWSSVYGPDRLMLLGSESTLTVIRVESLGAKLVSPA